MFRNASRAVAVALVFGLTTVLFTVPSGAATRAQVQGVTDDEIQLVVLVPDFDALLARGFPVGGGTNQGFAQRFMGHVDDFGPINGRKVVAQIVAWDPLDNTSYDKACTQATQDNKPFMIVNGSGFRDTAYPCLTVDNDTPFMSGDFTTGEIQKAAGKNLVLLGLPPEVAAANAARLLDKTGQLPKSAKIGILSGNLPGIKAAGDTLEKELKKRGFNVTTKIELNSSASDPNVVPREAATAAGTFQSAGVDTVFNVASTTLVGSFFSEAARASFKPQVYSVDGQQNLCTQTAAGRSPLEADGMICISTYANKVAADGTGIRPDTDFEAECRARYEAFKGFKTTPNGPSNGATIGGVAYTEDMAPNECTLANLLLPAMKKAGKNLTWDRVYKNIMATKKAPAAYMSNGEGGFAKNKPYFAKAMHFTRLHRADATTTKGANGLYNSCPIPANCFVPFTVDGQEWFNVKG